MLSITNAIYLGNYRIFLSFNDGNSGEANLYDVIFSDLRLPFLPLREENEFKKFKLEHQTLVWSDELDLAPEFLFFITFRNHPEFQSQFKTWGYI